MTAPKTPYRPCTPDEYPSIEGLIIHVDDLMVGVRCPNSGDVFLASPSNVYAITAWIDPDGLDEGFELPKGFKPGGNYMLATGPLSKASARVFARALAAEIRDTVAEGLCDPDGGTRRGWSALRRHTWIPLSKP